MKNESIPFLYFCAMRFTAVAALQKLFKVSLLCLKSCNSGEMGSAKGKEKEDFRFSLIFRQRRMDYICLFESFIDPTLFGLHFLQESKLHSVLQLIILRVKGDFIRINCLIA